MAKKAVKRKEKKKSVGGKPSKAARRPTARPAKRAVKKPAKKLVKKPVTKPAKRPIPKPASRPTQHVLQPEAVKTERTWVVWHDGRGVWLGSPEEFRQSKRPETIICDVIDHGTHRDFDALRRAAHVGQVLRETYANCLKPWLQYSDAAQEQRIREWEQRLRALYVAEDR